LVAGALLDPRYRAALVESDAHAVGAAGLAWFADEQARVHSEVNRIWPRRFGTTPSGMARAFTAHSSAMGGRYRRRPFRGRRDKLTGVLAARGSFERMIE
jgi:hypothetical protein